MKGKIVLALVLLLALLAGCGEQAAPDGSVPTSGSQSAPQGTEETEGDALSPEELEQLEGLAFCYERYCGGRSLDQGETVEATSWMAIAYPSPWRKRRNGSISTTTTGNPGTAWPSWKRPGSRTGPLRSPTAGSTRRGTSTR